MDDPQVASASAVQASYWAPKRLTADVGRMYGCATGRAGPDHGDGNYDCTKQRLLSFSGFEVRAHAGVSEVVDSFADTWREHLCACSKTTLSLGRESSGDRFRAARSQKAPHALVSWRQHGKYRLEALACSTCRGPSASPRPEGRDQESLQRACVSVVYAQMLSI